MWKQNYFNYDFHVAQSFDLGFLRILDVSGIPEDFELTFWTDFQSETKVLHDGWFHLAQQRNCVTLGDPGPALEILWWLGGKLRFRVCRIEGLWLSKVDCRIFCRSGEPGPESDAGPVWSVFLWGRKAGPPSWPGSTFPRGCWRWRKGKRSIKCWNVQTWTRL